MMTKKVTYDPKDVSSIHDVIEEDDIHNLSVHNISINSVNLPIKVSQKVRY